MYNLDSVLMKTISPKMNKDKKDIIIISFAWSNKQQRVKFNKFIIKKN